MPKHSLPVPHHRQQGVADCLATCARMVLEYLGVSITYSRILQLLGTTPYGTPGRHRLALQSLGVDVSYGSASLEEVRAHIRQGRPCIALVRTSEIPYWTFSTDHAVVVIGYDETHLLVNDPHFEQAPQRIPADDFVLAWLEFDYRCSVIQRRGA